MRAISAVVVAASAPLLVSAATPSRLVVTGDGVLAATLNGAPLRMMIDPAATAMPLVTAAAARRAGLKPSFFDFAYRVGPQRITGNSAVARIDVGSGPDKRRVGWSDRPWRSGVDGVIGPGMLDQTVVHFQLRAPQAGEIESRFPLVDQGGIEGRWGERFARLDLGGRALRLQFDPQAPATLATAQAGSLVAEELGGTFAGAPRSAPIAFGVARPVRRMQLSQPLAIGSLSLTELDVRTGDFGSAGGIAEQGDADPSEIVVTARTKWKAQYDQIKLGRDVLQNCSSITFDRAAKRVTLRCR